MKAIKSKSQHPIEVNVIGSEKRQPDTQTSVLNRMKSISRKLMRNHALELYNKTRTNFELEWNNCLFRLLVVLLSIVSC